jgi:DNA repair protein RadC
VAEATAAYRLPVSEWPEGEQPREKLCMLGPEMLSDAELLAILLRTGVTGQDVVSLAVSLLGSNGGLVGLARLSTPELTAWHGLGVAKSATLRAGFELGRRALLGDATAERRQVRSAHDVASLLEATLRGLNQEQLHVVLLSTRNHVIGTRKVYVGNLTTSIVRPAEVFRDAIRESASSIIVAHNHPSGDPTPSGDDVRVTRDLVAAGRLLDIDVLDHLVIGDQRHGYVSLRERKLGFEPA